MQPRKYITVQRSAHKQPIRPTYELSNYRQTYDTNFHDLNRYGATAAQVKIRQDYNKSKYNQVHKSPSESNFRSRQQYIKGNIQRRKGDGMVSNLKSELQNLKMEVSKLTSRDRDFVTDKQRDRDVQIKGYTTLSRRNTVSVRNQEDDIDSQSLGSSSLSGYQKQISDTISVTSEKIINQPLRRLQSKFSSSNYDHAHYMELENDLLKTELRNLKNKYNITKQELRQKCQAFQKKNEYLEISLRRSQQTLIDCKKSLQQQLQTIKFQVARKLQEQYENESKNNDRTFQPVRDSLGQNELVKQKFEKLYQQLSEKSKTISSINIDLNQTRSLLQKNSFEIKKQVEKNNDLMKQLQFSKRQNLRNKNMLQMQVNKKVELTKSQQQLRQKINQLTKQLQLHSQIAVGSAELQNKYSQQLKNMKQNQQRVSQQNYELHTKIRKLKQLIQSHQQQIKHLKLTIHDFTLQVEQLSKSLRIQKQKSIETQQSYRRILDQAKLNSQKQLQILQKQFDRYRQNTKQIMQQNEQERSVQRQNYDVKKQKDRQISKWKAQYKMLKLRYEEKSSLQNTKKQEIQSYYKNFKQYKSKNKILEMRNKILEDSLNQYLQKISKLQSQYLLQRVQYLQKSNMLNIENQQLRRKTQQLQQQLTELKLNLQSQTLKASQQQKHRKQIQIKIMNINLQNHEQIIELIQKVKKKASDQDQKINKYIKQLKNKQNLIKQLKKQIRSMLETQQNQLQKFRAKQVSEQVQNIQQKTMSRLQQLRSQSKKQIGAQMQNNKQLIDQLSQMKGQFSQIQNQNIKLKQQIKSITHLYNLKTVQLQEINDKLEIIQSSIEIKNNQIGKIKDHAIKSLQSELLAKNDEIFALRAEIKKYLSIKNTMEDHNFDQALKNQMEASKRLREELDKKNEQTYRLRDQNTTIKAQLDNLKSQYDIAKLKFISDKKNLQIQFDVDSQNLKTQLSLQQKKVSSLDQKIKMIIDQNKKKDNFIQTYIMGKKLPTNQRQMMTTFLKQYQVLLSGKQISDKLQSQTQQLEKMAIYNFNLMKQIAQMKQKLLLYEAISVDNSQVHQNQLAEIDSFGSKGSLSISQTNSPKIEKQFSFLQAKQY